MVMRTCSGCGTTKAESDFYVSSSMRCKECVKSTVKARRLKKLDEVRAYDRARAELPHRRVNAVNVTRAWRRRHRERMAAHNAAQRAQAKGVIAQVTQCEHCGAVRLLNKHHHDYSKPLMVVWLCKPCHVIADKCRRRLETA